MAEEIEDLLQLFADSASEVEHQCFQLYKFKLGQKQLAIKTDLEVSHLKVTNS